MAVIQKIRNQYGKIAGGIIAVSLVAFIVSDARNGAIKSVFGGDDNYVVSINGKKIDAKTYQQRVHEYETLMEIYQPNQPLNEASKAQIREQVLQQMEYETVVNDICDKMGIVIPASEENDMIYGDNAHPMVRQFTYSGQQVFNDPNTKQFDKNRVKGIEDQMKKDPKSDPYGKYMDSWNSVKAFVTRNLKMDKFNTLMAASAIVPNYVVKRNMELGNSLVSARYVKVPYTAIPDAEVKISEDDLKAYVDKHKKMFLADQAARSIEYVSFDIVPSVQDTQACLTFLNGAKEEFATAKDLKNFVSAKSEENGINPDVYIAKKMFPSRYADTLYSLPVGSVYGPYQENGAYYVAKVADKKTLPDSVKFREIIVVVNTGKDQVMTDEAANKKMDSIITAMSSGVPYDSLNKLSSNYDPNNPKGEVNITLAQKPQISEGLSKDIADFVFDGKAGEKKKIKCDKSKDNGPTFYSYVEIMEQKDVQPCAQIALISKKLLSSDSTNKAIYSKAIEFGNKATNGKAFDEACKAMNLQKRNGDFLKETSQSIEGLGAAREVVRWAYEAKLDEVKQQPFTIGDQRFVVAKLSAIVEKNTTPVTPSMKPQLEQIVREEKKAEKLKAKYGKAALEQIAQENGQAVEQADSIRYTEDRHPKLGFEPKVMGYLFNSATQPNAVSTGIQSQGGVYFVSLANKTPITADPVAMQNEMMQKRQQEEGQLRNFMTQMLQQTLTKSDNKKYLMKNF